MKIALISRNKNSLHEMSTLLNSELHSVVAIHAGTDTLQMVMEKEQPELVLVDQVSDDPSDFERIEHITAHYPKAAIVLLCAAPTPEFLLNAMRAGVREVLPAPATAEALTAAVNRVAAKATGGQRNKAGKVLAFIPCKGGSGATFLATNLGYQLAEKKSVLLIDLNLQFGDALSFVYDHKPTSTLADVARDIHRLDASFLAASTVKISQNYSILAAPEDPSHSIEVKGENIEAILALATTQYDYVLLDMGRNIDTLSMKALDHAYRIYPVLQMGLPYLRNAKKLLEAFESLGYAQEKIEVIVNRFEKHAEIGMAELRRLLGEVSIYTVPNSYKDVNVSINQGTPLIELVRSSAVIRNLADFTLALNSLSMDKKQPETKGFLGRLFKRA